MPNVAVVLQNNAFDGAKVPLEFDPLRGSVACFDYPPTGGVRIEVFLGPFESCEPQTALRLTVYDGERAYDLKTDPGPPGMVEPGLIRLGASYSPYPGYSLGYDTINQSGVGTIDVRKLPSEDDARFEFRATGWIASPDGWNFDLVLEAGTR